MDVKWLSAAVLVACVLMLLRLCLRPAWRERFDRACRKLVRAPMMFVHRFRASRATAEAIRRAKSAGEWEGNVYTPKSFKRPRKPH